MVLTSEGIASSTSVAPASAPFWTLDAAFSVFMYSIFSVTGNSTALNLTVMDFLSL